MISNGRPFRDFNHSKEKLCTLQHGMRSITTPKYPPHQVAQSYTKAKIGMTFPERRLGSLVGALAQFRLSPSYKNGTGRTYHALFEVEPGSLTRSVISR